MNLTELIVIGGGDHARVLLDAFELLQTRPTGIIDPNLEVGSEVLGVPVIDDNTLSRTSSKRVLLVNGVGGAHTCGPRNSLSSAERAHRMRYSGRTNIPRKQARF